jgi:hypothetical protein
MRPASGASDTSDTSCSTTKTEAHVMCRWIVPSRHMELATGAQDGLAGTRMRLAVWSVEGCLNEHIFRDPFYLHYSSAFVFPATQGRKTHGMAWLGSSKFIAQSARSRVQPLRTCRVDAATTCRVEQCSCASKPQPG